MQSIAYTRASDGTTNASLMTVQTVRSSGATTIIVNTVSGVPAGGFFASMGTPHTFTDPVTGEVITIISEATAVDFAGHINAGQVIIDAIAPGYVDTNGSKVGDIIVVRPVTEWSNNIFNVLNKSLNDDGSLKTSAVVYNPTVADFIQTGGIWSAVSGLNATMTALTGYQAGYQGAVATVASRTFTASKDTYVDVLRTLSGYTNTFSIVYTEVANGAASPALAANSIRLAIIVTNGSTIIAINQGNISNATAPVIFGVLVKGNDSLGNSIYPIVNYLPSAPTSHYVAASESRTNSAYGLLTTPSSVTVTIGKSGMAEVTISAGKIFDNTATGGAFMSFAMSGANTLAASDVNSINVIASTANLPQIGMGITFLFSGLAPGVTTFTPQFRSTGTDIANFQDRRIYVKAL